MIISGRGGTGKTEVVSAVLKAAEEILTTSEDNDITEDGVNSDDSIMSKDFDSAAGKTHQKTILFSTDFFLSREGRWP